jgi:hypothetical protein
MAEPITITMSERTWRGLLIHLIDTIEQIPVSIIDPDPYKAVSITIAKIEKEFESR